MPVWWQTGSRGKPANSDSRTTSDEHLDRARASLRAIVSDSRIPGAVRRALDSEFSAVEEMLKKLEQEHIHIAVFGEVSVGKSALLNALLGESKFSTSPLHGETKVSNRAKWTLLEDSGVFLIDTPGLNEIAGEERENHAREVVSGSDLVLFVTAGDLNEQAFLALRDIANQSRPIILVLNKADYFTQTQRGELLAAIRERVADMVHEDRVVCVAADPAPQIVITIDENGNETESVRPRSPDVKILKDLLWDVLTREGKSLVALNAGLFAGGVTDRLADKIVATKHALATRVIRNYCLAKGILVAANPIPVADLLAASGIDATLIWHLSRVYGLPVDRHEAGHLVATIAAQLTLLMGTVWGVNFISSALKGGSLGLSTILTAVPQGAVAYYATHIVGKAADRYFSLGKSWGELGPKRLVKDILADTDRGSLLNQARAEIELKLR